MEWTIHQQALPGLDAKVDVPTVQVVGVETTQREIWEIYNDVYQLKRLPGPHCMAQNGLKNWPRISWPPSKTTYGKGGEENRNSTPPGLLHLIIQLRPLRGHDRGMMTPVTVPSPKQGRLPWQALVAAHLLEERI